jgi:hypothetical protein
MRTFLNMMHVSFFNPTPGWMLFDSSRPCAAQCREFAPAGDSLSWAPKKESKEAAPNAWPFGSAAGVGFAGPRTTHFVRFAHSVQTRCAKPVLDGAARRPAKPVLLAQARRGTLEYRHASLRIG